MKPFYQRIENEKEIKIIYKYQLLWWVVGTILIFLFMGNWIFFKTRIIIGTILAMGIVKVAGDYKANREISVARKNKSIIEIYGKATSLKNPRVIVIKK